MAGRPEGGDAEFNIGCLKVQLYGEKTVTRRIRETGCHDDTGIPDATAGGGLVYPREISHLAVSSGGRRRR
jgi:hypothetical protein